MPDPIRQALQAAKVRVPDTSRRQRREEPQWTEYSVLAYDGLMPTQIVLRMTDREGIDRWEATALPFRVDARADTDDRRNDKVPFLPADPTRYVDERRYVVDPMPGKHEVLGLWTGGPVRMTTDKRGGGIEVTRVLTRTFCAGHGYVTDEHGNYVAAFTEDGGTTFHDKDGHAIEASKVREYLSADDALRFHRASLGSRLSPYMLFRDDIPAAFTREVQWREFTHESIEFLDPLGLKPENRGRLSAIVGEKFKELAGEAVTNAACRVDAETNTVIFTAALTYSKLGEPVDPSDLLKLPCLETCDRDTLRMFGWGQLEDGEGYKYTHLFRWPRLKDTPEVRRALEFVKDNAPTRDVWADDAPDESGSGSASASGSRTLIAPAAPSFVLALLRRHGLLPATGDTAHAWFGDDSQSAPYEKRFEVSVRADQLDNTGRLVTSTTAISHEADASASGSGATVPSTADVPVQTYRIAKCRIEPDQDGSISFVVALAKSEWHGGDDGRNWEDVDANGRHGSRVLAAVSAPQGYGRVEDRVVVSVPRQNAIPTMEKIVARGDYELVFEKRQTEGGDGASDVSFKKRKLYNYVDVVPEGIQNLDGNPFNATDYHYDPDSNTYVLGWNYVAPKDLQKLVDSVRAKLGGEPVVDTVWHGEGYYTVRIRAKGKEPRHVREWTVSADWFQHQTLEQWIGVTVETGEDDSASGSGASIRGFYARYERNADGSYKLDEHGNLIPVPESFVPFAAIRGDLDANWMGSDPQTLAAVAKPTVFATTGAAAGGEGSKTALDGVHAPEPDHADEHGSGWSGGAWSDPDFGDGESSGGDAADKARSHSIVHVTPRRNQDGSYDVSITRTYPHQRYWEYSLPSMDKDGDEYLTFHMSYHNWPSRKAIQTDIVSRIKAAVDKLEAESGGSNWDWSDGWAIDGGFTVNKFGLVDAPGMKLVPTKENDKARVARARTVTEHREFAVDHPVRTYKAPAGKDPKKVPPNGYWEKIDVWHYSEGFTTSKTEAGRVANASFFSSMGGDGRLHEGSRGVWCVNNKNGIQSHWKWDVVYKVTPGTWDGDDASPSDGNNSTVDNGGGEGGGRVD